MGGGRERERDRQTDRQTETETGTEKQTERRGGGEQIDTEAVRNRPTD